MTREPRTRTFTWKELHVMLPALTYLILQLVDLILVRDADLVELCYELLRPLNKVLREGICILAVSLVLSGEQLVFVSMLGAEYGRIVAVHLLPALNIAVGGQELARPPCMGREHGAKYNWRCAMDMSDRRPMSRIQGDWRVAHRRSAAPVSWQGRPFSHRSAFAVWVPCVPSKEVHLPLTMRLARVPRLLWTFGRLGDR